MLIEITFEDIILKNYFKKVQEFQNRYNIIAILIERNCVQQ
jgi:hypothetical protein